MLFALSGGHKVGLALVAGLLVVFALASALLVPRWRLDFPGRGGLRAFLLATLVFFVGTLVAVELFGRESEEKASAKERSAGTAAPAPAGGGAAAVARGKQLYASLGCQSCHSLDGSKGIGPTFQGLAGSSVKLASGQTVTADEAYLVESIRDPDQQIVGGFQAGIMSATIKPGQVSEADAKAVAAFVETLK